MAGRGLDEDQSVRDSMAQLRELVCCEEPGTPSKGVLWNGRILKEQAHPFLTPRTSALPGAGVSPERAPSSVPRELDNLDKVPLLKVAAD